MHRIGSLKKISLILCFVLGFVLAMFGCVTTQSNANIGLTAEAVPEGITLAFDNIPAATERVFIIFNEYAQEELTSTLDIISTHVLIKDRSLEQVKSTGKVTLPYVKAGQKYHIAVAFSINGENHWARAECTPYLGTYFDGDINLNLSKDNASVALTSEPEFPADVEFAADKYTYQACVDLGEGESLSYSVNETNRPLAWDFEAQMSSDLKEGNYLTSGDYPTYIIAYCNVMHDNLLWNIEIAKTDLFNFSL